MHHFLCLVQCIGLDFPKIFTQIACSEKIRDIRIPSRSRGLKVKYPGYNPLQW